ncbi:hypothetical protein [Streptomyces sp. NPDC088727]|uniref:restriction endonuclease subunit S n=1 Tax=Streptomyces sp. NPDC088727 TaxID=3365875 RepID=UPI0038117A14
MSEDVRASESADYLALDHYLSAIDTGKSPAAQNTPAGGGEWGVLKVSAVQEGWFQSRENKVIRNAVHIHPRFEVRPGDLLMTRANTEALVGLACIAETPSPRLMLSDKTLRLVVNEEVADPAFVALALLRPATRNQVRAMATGTSAGMKNISQRQIRRLMVPCASLEQQRRIVAVHAAFERRIGGLERLLAKLRDVSDSFATQAMAAAPGVVPFGTWLQRIEAGKSPMAEDTPAGDEQWGVLKVSAVQPGQFRATENKVVHDSGLINPQYEVRAGDLLMTRANTEQLVGLACIARNPPPRLMLSDKTLRLVPDETVAEPQFMELTLLSPSVRRQIRAMATGTSGSMKNIAQDAVRRLLVPDVPAKEQKRVVAVVAASRRRAEAVMNQIAKTRVAQRAVSEELLRGAV